LLATGASSTGVTLKANEVEIGRYPSVTITPIVDEPLRFAVGTTVMVQFGAVPPFVTLETGEDEVTLTDELQSRVESTSEMVKLTTLFVSSFVVWVPIDEIVGASLAALTVRVNDFVSESVPSEATTVTVETPDVLRAGVRVSTHPGAVPDFAMLALGRRVVFEEVTFKKLEQFMTSSTSVTERVIEAGVSSFVD
jgi:hypothetical protein